MITSVVKPFIKWVGGKTQILPHLMPLIGKIFAEYDIKNYVEPFIGGGALFFLLSTSHEVNSAVISDINEDLILVYKTVQNFVSDLIEQLKILEHEYLSSDLLEREMMFYNIRASYNLQKIDFDYQLFSCDPFVNRSSKFIFLNKTCFNGLYRENRSGSFNVPFGKYRKPNICDVQNLMNCSIALQNVQIICGDFESTEAYVNSNTMVYLDPPYKPITLTSNFTKYHKDGFDDQDQIRLANYYKRVDAIGAKVILSNSDPVIDANGNGFFEHLYAGFDISKINVMRNVAAASSNRKQVKELIVNNLNRLG